MGDDNQSVRQGKKAPCVKKETKQSVTFIQHLEKSSEIVQTWPVWKQQLLGGTIKQQHSKTMPVTEHQQS